MLKYNNAVSYALGICELASRIGGADGIIAPWPRDEIPLGKNERLQMQRDLLVLGYDPGALDGVLGRKVRACTAAPLSDKRAIFPPMALRRKNCSTA